MACHRSIRVEVKHCDPARMVLFPRGFEMMNPVIETLFPEVASRTFGQGMTSRAGVPTATVATVCHGTSRPEDLVDWRLSPTWLGRGPVGNALRAPGGAVHRLTSSLTQVHINDSGRPQPWPQDLRDRMAAFMETA